MRHYYTPIRMSNIKNSDDSDAVKSAGHLSHLCVASGNIKKL